jgi:hypothetical protein
VIEIAATDRIRLTDSEITTSVAVGGGNGGDIGIPPRAEGSPPARPGDPDISNGPEMMIVNRSAITGRRRQRRPHLHHGRNVRRLVGSEISAAAEGGGIDGIVDHLPAPSSTPGAEPAQEFATPRPAADVVRRRERAAEASSRAWRSPASPEVRCRRRLGARRERHRRRRRTDLEHFGRRFTARRCAGGRLYRTGGAVMRRFLLCLGLLAASGAQASIPTLYHPLFGTNDPGAIVPTYPEPAARTLNLVLNPGPIGNSSGTVCESNGDNVCGLYVGST